MDVKETIIDVIAKQLDIKAENIKPKSDLVKDLKADSLDVVELVMSLEEKFNIQIPDEKAEKIQSVQNIIDYIKKRKKS